MRTLTLLSLFTIFSLSAKADDATIVANWQLPIYTWLQKDSVTDAAQQAQYARTEAKATLAPANFDAPLADFDATWAVAGTEFILGGTAANIIVDNNSTGVANGANDFTGSFKLMYDEYNIYLLVKYTDDDLQDADGIEIAWQQDLVIPAVLARTEALSAKKSWAYTRFSAFGGFKGSFTQTAFNNAMMINFDATGKGTVNWGGTTPILTNNLLVDNKSGGKLTGAGTVKQIITIGFPALTGEARPDFDVNIWKALNGGKGISFDIKYGDYDAADPKFIDSKGRSKDQKAGYWWSATSNDAYYLTWHAGFLAPDVKSAVKELGLAKSIFGKRTENKIVLTEMANASVYNLTGKQVKELSNVTEINISDLKKGVYMIRVNGETLKIVK